MVHMIISVYIYLIIYVSHTFLLIADNDAHVSRIGMGADKARYYIPCTYDTCKGHTM